MNFTRSLRQFVFITACLLTCSLSPARAAEPTSCPEVTAAQKGAAADEFLLGRAYDQGSCGVAVNKTAAEQWYLKASRQGHMLAAYELAETYFSGDGVKPDYAQAQQWYLAAARQGHGPSQLRLGFLYSEKHFTGATVDYAEAEKWYLKAAAQDAGDARFRLGNFYNNYKKPPDLASGFAWLSKAAEGGHRIAMFDAAQMLLEGNGVEKNIPLGLGWLRKAAVLDLLPAQMALNSIYTDGKIVPRNVTEALKWTVTIAEKKTASVFDINRAADLFFEGWESVPKNYPLARKFYERAAAKQNPHATARLGRMYLEGLGVTQDASKAAPLLKKAAALGNAEAKSLLDVTPPGKSAPLPSKL